MLNFYVLRIPRRLTQTRFNTMDETSFDENFQYDNIRDCFGIYASSNVFDCVYLACDLVFGCAQHPRKMSVWLYLPVEGGTAGNFTNRKPANFSINS